MKWLFVLVSAVFLLGLQTDHFVLVNSTDQTLANFLEEAYKYYSGKGLHPLPPCSGEKYPVYVDSAAEYSAYTEITKDSRCIIRMVFQPSYTKRLVYHEVGHVFFGRYDESSDYFWADEAVVEAMASVATGVYHYPSQFFAYRLYTVNPFELGEDRLMDWYRYSAAPAWYLASENWEWVLRSFSTKQGAASLYVRFLLAFAKGVRLGGAQFEPQREVIDVAAGVRRFEVVLDGFTASYYELRIVRPGGFLKISVDSPAVVSNVVLGREFYVENSTIYLGLVNNSTRTVKAAVEVYYSQFYVKVLGGFYDGGRISLDLYAEYGGVKIDGVVKINGSDVVFSGGVGRFNFTGPLRPYSIVAQYSQQTVYVGVDLRPVVVSASPKPLYLGRGGRGSLNVTIYNPNVVHVVCILNGSAAGVKFAPLRVVASPNSTAIFRLGFEVVGEVGNSVRVSCGDWGDSIAVRSPAYSLLYDLDSQSGTLEVRFGEVVRKYEVSSLPTNISVSHNGYVSLVVEIPQPTINVRLGGTPRFSAGLITYNVSVSVDSPVWAAFRGTVAIDGLIRGVYVGGVFNTVVSVRPGEVRKVYISVGRYTREVVISAPRIETVVEPLSAVVEGDKALILARAKHSVELEGSALLEFGGPGFIRATQLADGLLLLEYRYGENLRVEYTAWGERKVVDISLPRPVVQISLVRGVVSPQTFKGIFNATLTVCGVSIRSRYLLRVDGVPVSVYASPGGCSSNSTVVEKSLPYSSEIDVVVDAVLSRGAIRLSVPPPRVELLRSLWVIDNRDEVVIATLRIYADNYTYIVLGREVSGVKDLEISIKASNGTAVLDYGFNSLVLYRPALNISAPPAAVEVGVSTPLRVVLTAPRDLHIRGSLDTPFGSKYVEILPGGSIEQDIPLPRDARPGVYDVEISIGPYKTRTKVVRYAVNLTTAATQRVPVGYVVNIPIRGSVDPPVVEPTVILEVRGCVNLRERLRLGDVFSISLNRTCVVDISAYTNSSSFSTSIEWASLGVVYSYESLGSMGGLPVFAPRTLRAEATLGGRRVQGNIKIIGDFDRLGLVNYTVVVEYMGVVNRSTFVGIAAPPESYRAAEKVASGLPHNLRGFYMYLVEKAALSGDWRTVEKINQVYNAPPTPVTLVARYLVESSLAKGEEPSLETIDALFKVEPVIYGVVLGVALAAIRRFA